MSEAATDWIDYHAFRELKARGLRQDALKALGRFLDAMVSRPYEDRKAFVCWLFESDHHEDIFPLKRKVIEPLLAEWIALEPHEARPHYLLGSVSGSRIACYQEAHKRDPENPEYRIALANAILSMVDYQMHEMPFGYLGDDPSEDYALLQQSCDLLASLGTSPRCVEMRDEIDSHLEILGNYLLFKRDEERLKGETFAEWCARHGRADS